MITSTMLKKVLTIRNVRTCKDANITMDSMMSAAQVYPSFIAITQIII